MFDFVVVVDWSGKNSPGPKHSAPDSRKKDNIWIGVAEWSENSHHSTETYHRTRRSAEQFLETQLKNWVKLNKTVLVGFDFCLGYPTGFARLLTGRDSWTAVCEYLTALLEDDEMNRNNRFQVAGAINKSLPGNGPFWGLNHRMQVDGLRNTSPWKGKNELPFGDVTLRRLREADQKLKGVQEVWKLYGIGSVGSQSLTGIPVVHRLRHHPDLQEAVRVWPFEFRFREMRAIPDVVFAEIWPGLVEDEVQILAREPAHQGAPRDQLQVRTLARQIAEAAEKNELKDWFVAAENMEMACLKEEGAVLGPINDDNTNTAKK